MGCFNIWKVSHQCYCSKRSAAWAWASPACVNRAMLRSGPRWCSPDTKCAGCYVRTWECFWQPGTLGSETMWLVSDFTFISELEETSACEARSRTRTACLSIWKCCKKNRVQFSLSVFIKTTIKGVAMGLSSCMHKDLQLLWNPFTHVGGSMTLSVYSQSWRCGHGWEWSVCATVCLGSCRTPGWEEDRASSAAPPACQACQGNQAPAEPRVQMAMWVSREEMAEMAGRGKRERRETQVYYK